MSCFLVALQEVPDSTDIPVSGKPSQSSPVMKQSIERVCSCDPHESCPCCSPESPASSPEEPVDTDLILTSSHLIDQLSGQSADAPDQKVRQTNPNFHLLQQLKKQLIIPSTKLAAASSLCDQPLDLSFNSTRAQQLATSCSSSTKGQFDHNSLLEVASGGSDAVITPLPAQK